jgi:hypothetical protein
MQSPVITMQSSFSLNPLVDNGNLEKVHLFSCFFICSVINALMTLLRELVAPNFTPP